jgi:hypothetical protein
MKGSVPLLLAHEMPSIDPEDNARRHAVNFPAFFSCVEGTTPRELLSKGIYDQIAIALKNKEWRHASLVLIAIAIAKNAGQSQQIESIVRGNAVSQIVNRVVQAEQVQRLVDRSHQLKRAASRSTVVTAVRTRTCVTNKVSTTTSASNVSSV